jgi:hypothetical protein
MNECVWGNGGIILRGTEILRGGEEETVPLSLFAPQISNTQVWDGAKTFVLTGQQLTATGMARTFECKLKYSMLKVQLVPRSKHSPSRL